MKSYLLAEGVLIRYCENCKRKASVVIVKNRMRGIGVYCLECNSRLRDANKADLADLKAYTGGVR